LDLEGGFVPAHVEEEFFVPSGVERMADDACAEDLFGEGDDDEWVHVEAGAGDWKKKRLVYDTSHNGKRTILQPRQITSALDLKHDDPDDIIRMRSGEVVICLFIRP